MTTNGKIRDKKLQYDINKATAKISALSLSKIDKYKYLTDEEILPTQQHILTKILYFLLDEVIEKQIKAIEEQGKNQAEAIQFLNLTTKTEELKQLEDIFSQNQLSQLINGRLKGTVEMQSSLKLSKINR